MLQTLAERAHQILAWKPADIAPIVTLLDDDDFCTLMMQLRMEQGMRLPKQNPDLPPSLRLGFLHALAAGEGERAARNECDGRAKLEKSLRKAKDSPDEDVRAYLVPYLEKMLQPGNRNSDWSAKYLLFGRARISQEAIPLHEAETSAEDVVHIVTGLLQDPVAPLLDISDRQGDTGEVAFIRIGLKPDHFSFPETASAKTGTNAAVFHYEIDHPGGDFLFFNQIEHPGGAAGKFFSDLEEHDPLYINDLHQLMARNSYYLHGAGIFHVPAGDTRVTMLLRDGVLSAAVDHDQTSEAGSILEALRGRGMSREEEASMSPFLNKAEVEDDYDWDTIERLQSEHPDLLGYAGMGMERSYIFGVPKAALFDLLLQHAEGDEAKAAADLEIMSRTAEAVPLEAGRYHLHVPNLASTTRHQQGLEALDRAVGRKSEDLWFVLADHKLDLGSDPHMMSSMRKLNCEPPAPEPVCDSAAFPMYL